MGWTTRDIPDLQGTTVLVTGANTGLGLETAAALAGAGATTVLACRNLTKGAAAQAEIASRRPRGDVQLLQLDLADLGQVQAAAQEALERFPRIDRLVNNAGLMNPTFTRTADGFESAFGTNHLGHFAFTGRVLPALLAAPGSRVVTVSSMSHKMGTIRWDLAEHERGYKAARAYAQSKLANLLFAFELQRRLERSGASTLSLAAHPGFAATDFLNHAGEPNALKRLQAKAFTRFIPTPAQAALAQLRAATDPDAAGGQYYGPDGRMGIKGDPVVVAPGARSQDLSAAARLWDWSVELTGVEYPLEASAAAG